MPTTRVRRNLEWVGWKCEKDGVTGLKKCRGGKGNRPTSSVISFFTFALRTCMENHCGVDCARRSMAHVSLGWLFPYRNMTWRPQSCSFHLRFCNNHCDEARRWMVIWLIHPKLDRDFWRFFRFFQESITGIQFFSLKTWAFVLKTKNPGHYEENEEMMEEKTASRMVSF